MRKNKNIEKRKRSQNKCEFCGEFSKMNICQTCIRRYNINKYKRCSNCRFYKNSKCNITNKETKEYKICLYFINKELKV